MKAIVTVEATGLPTYNNNPQLDKEVISIDLSFNQIRYIIYMWYHHNVAGMEGHICLALIDGYYKYCESLYKKYKDKMSDETKKIFEDSMECYHRERGKAEDIMTLLALVTDTHFEDVGKIQEELTKIRKEHELDKLKK